MLTAEGNSAFAPTPDSKTDTSSPPSGDVTPPSAAPLPAHEHDHSYGETSHGHYNAWNSHNTPVTGQENIVFTSVPVGTSQFGTFSLENGTLTFTPNDAVMNQLGPGQHITETFTTVDANGQSHTITLTFTGSNANDDTLTVVDFTAGAVTATNAVGGSTPFTLTPEADGSITLGAGNDRIFITGTMSGGNIIDMSADGSKGSSATVLTMGSNATLTTGAGADAITSAIYRAA